MRSKFFLSLFFIFFSFLSPQISAHSYGVYEDHPYEFKIDKSVSKFAETYHIFSPSAGSAASTNPPTYAGKVKKSAFRIRTNYDLSDQHGWQATGITRILSLGVIYPWATDIDIYDTRGVQIGMIDGHIATLESAKFSIYSYDESGKATEVAIALANNDFTRFSFSTPTNGLPLAEMFRNANEETWTVLVNTPNVIDDRIVRIFAGFVMNYQDTFLQKVED